MYGRKGRKLAILLYIYMLRLTEYAFRMFDNNKTIQNLRVKKLAWNQLNGLQLFTINSTITRRYTLRDQTEVLFFSKGMQTKREQSERNWKRTQIKLQRQRMQDSKDMHSYIVLYIQQICMCMCVCVCKYRCYLRHQRRNSNEVEA